MIDLDEVLVVLEDGKHIARLLQQTTTHCASSRTMVSIIITLCIGRLPPQCHYVLYGNMALVSWGTIASSAVSSVLHIAAQYND